MTYYAYAMVIAAPIELATRHARTCRRLLLLCATRIDRLYRDDEYDVYDVYDDACDDDDDGGCREHRGNRTHHFDAKSAQ
jgi:hypothetical protein